MKKIILGFAGEIASGKGTAIEYLKTKTNASMYKFSQVLRDILKRIHQEESRENLQKLSTVLREKFGQDVLSEIITKDIENNENQWALIDGIRRLEDISLLIKNPNFHLIYIEASMENRYKRIIKRRENTDETNKTWEEFQKDNANETEQQIKTLKNIAKYTINNDGTQEELFIKLEELQKTQEGV